MLVHATDPVIPSGVLPCPTPTLACAGRNTMEQVGNNTYQLELPAMLGRLHPVFNISLLKPYIPPSTFSDHLQSSGTIPEVLLEDGNVLQLKEILDVQKVG